MLKIKNRLGKTKVVGHTEIALDLLAIPSDISFTTKASGDDNSFVTLDMNSFATSTSRQSRRSKHSKLSQARKDYLL